VSAAASSPVRLGLIGSPNSGKTTLFNALTGLRARVGNYPGVTVERREGEVRSQGAQVRVIDLPGTYSLTPLSEDEAVVARVLEGRIAEVPPPDGLVLTVDATSLERSLVLVAEVLRLERPVCLVLTMMDELAGSPRPRPWCAARARPPRRRWRRRRRSRRR
jgi:ferrous iron transport protein B